MKNNNFNDKKNQETAIQVTKSFLIQVFENDTCNDS